MPYLKFLRKLQKGTCFCGCFRALILISHVGALPRILYNIIEKEKCFSLRDRRDSNYMFSKIIKIIIQQEL